MKRIAICMLSILFAGISLCALLVAVNYDSRAVAMVLPGEPAGVNAAFETTLYTPTGKLAPSSGDDFDLAGYSSDISHDGNTAILGMPQYDVITDDVGCARVFTRIGGSWSEQQILANPFQTYDASMGTAVVLSADGNTAFVGAPGTKVGSTYGRGYVYIFTRSGIVWSLSAYIEPDHLDSLYFGYSLALSQDENTLVVGAPLDNVGSTPTRGSVYIFDKIGGVWTFKQKLGVATMFVSANYGWSVGINSDGTSLIIGAPWDDSTTYQTGTAYVYVLSEGDWTLQQKLYALDAVPGDNFGYAVALNGNGNTAIIGAKSRGPSVIGAAYVFTRSGATWSQQQLLTIPNKVNMTVMGFGYAAAINDAGDLAVISAPWVSGFDPILMGAAWVFQKSGNTWVKGQILYDWVNNTNRNMDYGASVALSPDGNHLVIGADFDGYPDLTGPGAGYVYQRLGMTVSKQDSADPVSPGAQITYSLRVANTGLFPLHATITDVLPAHVSPGGVRTWTTLLPASTGVWTQTVIVTVDPAFTGTLANQLQVSTAEGPSAWITETTRVKPISCFVRLNNNPTIYSSLQEAVDASTNPNDLVKVAGTCTDINHYAGLSQVLYLNKTISIQGGYTLTNWTVPDPIANPTTLDAGGLGRVIYIEGVGVHPTISGLRITGGNAEGLGGGPEGADGGGGVRVQDGGVSLQNCEIYSNTADKGGGMYLVDDSSSLGGNFFHNNLAWETGGGLEVLWSNTSLVHNTFQENLSGIEGGGVSIGLSEMTLTANTVLSNTTGSMGGGLGGGLAVDQSIITFTFNTVSGNESINDPAYPYSGSAGGVHFSLSTGTVENNLITANIGFNEGGILVFDNPDPLVFRNNLITHNRSQVAAGGVGLFDSNAITLTNNVIADNYSAETGSGLVVFGTNVTMQHNTFARNQGRVAILLHWGALIEKPAIVSMSNTILVSHTTGISVTEGNTLTVNAILWDSLTPITVTQETGAVVFISDQHTGDPAFTADGYHLSLDSAATDVGVASGVTDDIDGQPRPMGAFPDLGADEFPEVFDLPPGGADFTTYDGLLTFDPPAGLTGTLTVVYAPLETPGFATGDFLFAGAAFHLDAYDQFGNPVTSFSPPITLTIHYDEDALPPGMPESSLELWRYDAIHGVWVVLPTVLLDTDANILVIRLDHFSEFSLLGLVERKVFLPVVVR